MKFFKNYTKSHPDMHEISFWFYLEVVSDSW